MLEQIHRASVVVSYCRFTPEPEHQVWSSVCIQKEPTICSCSPTPHVQLSLPPLCASSLSYLNQQHRELQLLFVLEVWMFFVHDDVYSPRAESFSSCSLTALSRTDAVSLPCRKGNASELQSRNVSAASLTSKLNQSPNSSVTDTSQMCVTPPLEIVPNICRVSNFSSNLEKTKLYLLKNNNNSID